MVSDDSADGSPLSRVGACRARPATRRERERLLLDRRPRSGTCATGIPPVPGGSAADRHAPAVVQPRTWATTWVTLPTGTDPLDGGVQRRPRTSFGAVDHRLPVAEPRRGLGARRGPPRAAARAFPARTPTASVGHVEPAAADHPQGRQEQEGRDVGRGPDPRRRRVDRHRRQPRPADGTDADAFGQQRGAKGAVYLGTIGHPTNEDVDTLWWFDGDETWYPTGLRNHADGVPAPVTAIVCDPAFPDEVYVGTTVGVWRGARTLHGSDPPTWDWAAAAERPARGRGRGPRHSSPTAGCGCCGPPSPRAACGSCGSTSPTSSTAPTCAPTTTTCATATDAVETQARRRDAALVARQPRRAAAGGAAATCRAPASLPWTSCDGRRHRRDAAAPLPGRAAVADRRPALPGDRRVGHLLRGGAARQRRAGRRVRRGQHRRGLLERRAGRRRTPPPSRGARRCRPRPTCTTSRRRSSRATVDAPSRAALPARPAKVDVVVHHRGLDPLDGADVRVTLLQWIDPRPRNRAKHDDATDVVRRRTCRGPAPSTTC